jgi:hypothetical protein
MPGADCCSGPLIYPVPHVSTGAGRQGQIPIGCRSPNVAGARRLIPHCPVADRASSADSFTRTNSLLVIRNRLDGIGALKVTHARRLRDTMGYAGNDCS